MISSNSHNLHPLRLTLSPPMTPQASSDFGCMLSVGAIRFEDRFCASKKGGIGGGGQVSAQGAVHMAAALASSRKGVRCI